MAKCIKTDQINCFGLYLFILVWLWWNQLCLLNYPRTNQYWAMRVNYLAEENKGDWTHFQQEIHRCQVRQANYCITLLTWSLLYFVIFKLTWFLPIAGKYSILTYFLAGTICISAETRKPRVPYDQGTA